MSNITLKLVYKYGGVSLELELSGDKEVVEEFLDKILNRFQMTGYTIKESVEPQSDDMKMENHMLDEHLNIEILSSDSLPDIINKIFYSGWGRTPRSLREVMDILNRYGLFYSKSTVAVTLKRLVEKGSLRRIKGKDGVFKYVTSTPVMGDK
ncbi:TPA: hypothetical protein EYP83_04615 [Candidatus Geothermarchaeota archaeon]|nr:hypothetical protein [Candidatus Geothermarchaeota archaeon]HIQ13227.1 hypothetical protein [Thermoprotei archaeon]